MSGRRRETHLATKLGELVADGARTRGKCAKTMHRVHAAEACSFCAESRAGRSIPATCGKRVPAEGEGEMPRGRACAQSRRTYSSTGPPAGFTSESAGRDRWPPPSDKVTKRSYEKNESVVHATPLAGKYGGISSRCPDCGLLRCSFILCSFGDEDRCQGHLHRRRRKLL